MNFHSNEVLMLYLFIASSNMIIESNLLLVYHVIEVPDIKGDYNVVHP